MHISMNTIEKHSIWELEVEGFKQLVLASRLIKIMTASTDSFEVGQSLLKAQVAKSALHGRDYARCSSCDCPLNFIAKSATAEAHFRHISSRAPDIEKMMTCSFYSGAESFFGSNDQHKQEGLWHFDTKHFLANQIAKNPNNTQLRVEKFIFSKDPDIESKRQPDIYFHDENDNPFAIELVRWWLSPTLISQREHFYREQGINLLWLFSENAQEVNAATLHQIMYGSAASVLHINDDVLSSVQCNAFIVTDDSKAQMDTSTDIVFDVLYPIPSFSTETNAIEIEKHQKTITLNALSLDPTSRLPFGQETSESFRAAILTKSRRVRKERFDDLCLLRKMAYNKFDLNTLESDMALSSLVVRLSEVVNDDHATSIQRYIAEAKANQREQQQAHDIALYRLETAKKLRELRRSVLSLMNVMAVAKDERSYNNATSRIGNMIKRAVEYHSPHYVAFLKRSLRKVEARNVAVHTANAVSNKNGEQSRVRHINEITAFQIELRTPLNGRVIDEAKLRTKAKRLQNEANRYGFYDSANALGVSVEHFIEETILSYWKLEYPCLVKDWKSDVYVKSDLDKAFKFVKTIPFKRDPNRAAILTSIEYTHRLLNQFLEDRAQQVEGIYLSMFEADQGELSAIALKTTKFLMRLKQCLLYYQHNNKSINDELWDQLSVIESTINDINNSTPLHIVVDRLKYHLRTRNEYRGFKHDE